MRLPPFRREGVVGSPRTMNGFSLNHRGGRVSEFQKTVRRPWWIFPHRLHFLKQRPVERRTYGPFFPGFPGDRPPTAERTLMNLFQSLHQSVSILVCCPTVPVRKISSIYYRGKGVDPLRPEAQARFSLLTLQVPVSTFQAAVIPSGANPFRLHQCQRILPLALPAIMTWPAPHIVRRRGNIRRTWKRPARRLPLTSFDKPWPEPAALEHPTD